MSTCLLKIQSTSLAPLVMRARISVVFTVPSGSFSFRTTRLYLLFWASECVRNAL